MTITITVGTNSYVSLVDAETYHTTYANTDWTGLTDDEAKKQALVLATQAVDLLYGTKFMSILASSSQALLFPRLQFTDNNGRLVSGIPSCLANAVAELALKQLNGDDIFPTANTTGNVKAESITVGGISIRTDKYAPASVEAYEGFNKVEIMLRPVLKQVSGNWSLRA